MTAGAPRALKVSAERDEQPSHLIASGFERRPVTQGQDADFASESNQVRTVLDQLLGLPQGEGELFGGVLPRPLDDPERDGDRNQPQAVGHLPMRPRWALQRVQDGARQHMRLLPCRQSFEGSHAAFCPRWARGV